MRKASILTLLILKSLYPQANFDAVSEGFVLTCTEDEAIKLVEDSAVMASQIVEMLPVDMSLFVRYFLCVRHHVTYVILNETSCHLTDLSHAQVHNLSYREL
jgi:hypothetical protein